MTEETNAQAPAVNPTPPAPPPAPPQPKTLYGLGSLLAVGIVAGLFSAVTIWKLLKPAPPPPAPVEAVPPEWARTPAGGPAAALPWTPGAPVAFDGTAAYSVVDPAPGADTLLDGQRPASVSLWFKRGALRGDALFIKGADPFMCMAHFSNPETHKLYFYFKRGGDGTAIRVFADGFTEAGEWVHLAVTYDGSGKAGGVSIYKNGTPQPVEIVNDSLSGPVENPGPVVLGAYRAARNLDWFFTGELAAFALTDRALSAAEVEALAKTPPAH